MQKQYRAPLIATMKACRITEQSSKAVVKLDSSGKQKDAAKQLGRSNSMIVASRYIWDWLGSMAMARKHDNVKQVITHYDRSNQSECDESSMTQAKLDDWQSRMTGKAIRQWQSSVSGKAAWKWQSNTTVAKWHDCGKVTRLWQSDMTVAKGAQQWQRDMAMAKGHGHGKVKWLWQSSTTVAK